MPSEPTPLDGNVCKEPDCGKPTRARGFCVACYYRHLRKGDFEAGTPTGKWKHRLSSIDTEARTAICAECGPTKIRARDKGARFRCSTDADSRSRIYQKAYRASKVAEMEDACEACGSTENLHWDHNHATGLYRGTLCGGCNTGIGLMNEDPERLIAAAQYLIERGTKHDPVAASTS